MLKVMTVNDGGAEPSDPVQPQRMRETQAAATKKAVLVFLKIVENRSMKILAPMLRLLNQRSDFRVVSCLSGIGVLRVASTFTYHF
jgi:hypothetical protein